MRLAVRLSSAIVATSLAVFGGYGVWLLLDEASDLHHTTERELRFVGTSLRVGIENALRDRQLLDVEETTLRLEGVDAPIDVFVFGPSGGVVAAPGGLPSGTLAEQLDGVVAQVLRDQETQLVRSRELPSRTLLLATPLLSDEGDLLGVVSIARPLNDVNADLLETTGGVVFTIGTFVLLAALVGTWVGDRWLARPLTDLARAMGRVRLDDFGQRLPIPADHEVAAVTREYNRMLDELEEARRRAQREAEGRREALQSLQVADRLVTLGQLSAAVAHEIGSPLQVLHGRARALVDRPHDPEATARIGRILVDEVDRIGRLVSQLVSLTRHRTPTRSDVDLAEASGEVCGLLELEARRRGVGLAGPEGPPAVVSADPDQVRQVVLNLVSNALAATSRGGHVQVTVEPDAIAPRLVVADDGVGMNEEVRARAFEPLFTTRADRGGAGLGLAVVRGIVEEHGGHVELESEEGRGARFVVHWPRGGAR